MSLLRAACKYAAHGWAVLPLKPGSKAPLGRLVPNGFKDATTDLATVFSWWQAEPEANVGIYCRGSGIVAIDVDPRSGGATTIHALRQQLGDMGRDYTLTASTGGGGLHLIFNHPGVDLVGKMGDGVDVKDEGYILASPSIHPSGGRYRWINKARVNALPGRWLDRMTTSPLERRELVVTDDDLRLISANVYAPLLGVQMVQLDWGRCPFHGSDSSPSFYCTGPLWCCYGCPAPPGKRAEGGNVLDLAARLWDFPTPLWGSDYHIVRSRLEALMHYNKEER